MSGSFDEFMRRLEKGEPDAETEVFHRLYNRLKAFAATRLHAGLRPKVEASDVVNSALKSFHKVARAGDYHAEGWHNLWQILVDITRKKCARQAKKYETQKREIRREQSLQPYGDDSETGSAPADSQPTPEDIVECAETLEWLQRQVTERQFNIFLLRAGGWKRREIAEEILGCSETTVDRAVKVIGNLLMERGWTTDGVRRLLRYRKDLWK